MIQFVSSEILVDDDYIKEIVYLCLDNKYRVCYLRKKTKNGNLFWTVATTAVNKAGAKEYYPAIMLDSNFLERDIRDFLDKRAWDNAKDVEQAQVVYSHDEQLEMPF